MLSEFTKIKANLNGIN